MNKAVKLSQLEDDVVRLACAYARQTVACNLLSDVFCSRTSCDPEKAAESQIAAVANATDLLNFAVLATDGHAQEVTDYIDEALNLAKELEVFDEDDPDSEEARAIADARGMVMEFLNDRINEPTNTLPRACAAGAAGAV